MPEPTRTEVTFLFSILGRGMPIIVLFLVLGACATDTPRPFPQPEISKSHTGNSESARWWYVRFRLRRSADEGTRSYLDALIADQILAPAIVRYETDIGLWRFHRRWPRDATGHQFSFIFYAPRTVASALIEQVGQHPELARLSSDGHLVDFRVNEAALDRATDPAASSDASWPPDVQREWPKFIMGASRMWLGLVQSEAAKHGDLEVHARYRLVEEALDEMWFKEANHAFFHHLSALFGYKPVRVIRHEIMTF